MVKLFQILRPMKEFLTGKGFFTKVLFYSAVKRSSI